MNTISTRAAMAAVGLASLLGCAADTANAPARADARAAADALHVDVDMDVDAVAVAETELDRLARDGATRAAIVVLDPRDGRILAAVGRPDASGEARRSAPVGSTLKPLSVGAAFDAGLDPSRLFDGHDGRLRLADGTELRDSHPRASMNARDAIAASSNVGVGQMVEAVGDEPIRALFGAIGAEVQGPPSWPAHGAGIGVAMSPLGLASAYTAFENEGVAIAPTSDGSGSRLRLFSAEAADAVHEMLEAAVSDEGTGRLARVDGVRVAGKTGTVEGAAVFAGLASAEGARYVVVVRVEAPRDAWGGGLAAPSFARVVEGLVR